MTTEAITGKTDTPELVRIGQPFQLDEHFVGSHGSPEFGEAVVIDLVLYPRFGPTPLATEVKVEMTPEDAVTLARDLLYRAEQRLRGDVR